MVCAKCNYNSPEGNRFCSSCGNLLTVNQPKKSSNKLAVLFFLIIIYVIVSYTWNSFSPIPKPSESVTTKASEQTLEVTQWDWKRGRYGNLYIAGTVKNKSPNQYRYVQVNFNIYDKGGAQIGSSLANVNNLEPWGTWKFEASVLQEHAHTAKLQEVSGF